MPEGNLLLCISWKLKCKGEPEGKSQQLLSTCHSSGSPCVSSFITQWQLTSVTPIPALSPSSGVFRYCMHVIHGHAFRQNSHTYKIKISFEIKIFLFQARERVCHYYMTFRNLLDCQLSKFRLIPTVRLGVLIWSI